MRKIALMVVALGLLGAVVPAQAQTEHWASTAAATTQFAPGGVAFGYSPNAWSAMQATGAPDTYPACADKPTAWAPLSFLEEPEALSVFYDPPVANPTRVDIYETNVGGFVTQVDVLVEGGAPVTIFTGPDTTPCPGILSIPFSTSSSVVGVVIHTQKVGFEEIDAVAVVN